VLGYERRKQVVYGKAKFYGCLLMRMKKESPPNC